MANVIRGEVWITDLGMLGKIRPCLILSVPTEPEDRVLMTLVAHTTSVQGTRFEVVVRTHFLHTGAFDCQQIVTVPQVRALRRLGRLSPSELALVEDCVRAWLGL